jgi:hypothetical protein
VQKKKGCHKKERNSQKSGSRNSAGCKAIASSMPKPKTRCTSVESRNHNNVDAERKKTSTTRKK